MAETARYKLTLAYEGTAFHGWQKQELAEDSAHAASVIASPTARWERRGSVVVLRTVQHVLEQAVRELLREPGVIVNGASRTDTGVHAGGAFPDGRPGGQVAAFTSGPIPEKGVGWPAERGTDVLVRALNSKLPEDVLVLGAEIVDVGFNPIAGAVRKKYTYSIVTGPTRPLWDRRFVFHCPYELDAGLMDAAAKELVGEHDFASFTRIDHGRETTVREVFSCGVEPVAGGGEGLRISVEGSGFLYNMVRIIAGTLVEAGRGRVKPDEIPGILAARDRAKNPGPTLPPEGLRLEWIEYA